MSAPKIHRLANTIQVGSETIAELTFSPIKGKHLRGIVFSSKGMLFDDLLTVAGRLCKQPPSVMDEIEGEDLEEVLEIVSGFISSGRKTGKKP